MRRIFAPFCVSILVIFSLEGAMAQNPSTSPSHNNNATTVEAKPFDIEQWWKRREPAGRTPISISADGQWLAVTMNTVLHEGAFSAANLPIEGGLYEVCGEEMIGSEVLLVERASGKVIRPFENFSGSFMPIWEPNGSRLLVLLQDAITRLPRLAVWRPGDEAPHVFSEATLFPTTGFASAVWLPEGGKVVFKHRTPQKLIRQRITHALIDSKNGVSYSEKSPPADTLAVLNTNTGEVRKYPEAADTVYSSWTFRLSPDGTKLAYAGRSDIGSNSLGLQVNWSKLTILDLKSGTIQSIGDTQPEGWGSGMSWSPDGQKIAWRAVSHGAPEKLLIADLSTGGVRDAALPVDAKEGYLIPLDFSPPAPPIWDANGLGFYVIGKDSLIHFSVEGKLLDTLPLEGEELGGIDWLVNGWPNSASPLAHRVPDNGEILLIRRRTIQRVNLTTRSVETILTNPKVTGAGLTQNWSERAWHAPSGKLYTLNPTENHGYALLETRLSEPKTVSLAFVSPPLGKFNYGVTKSLSWKLADGTSCAGTLLLPPNWKSDRLPPVVMELYGDDRDNGNLTLAALHDASNLINPHLLSQHGYAFFKPDMPQTDAAPAGSLVISAEAAADALRESGLVDAERIGVIGQSYGGYTVLSAVTGSKRFRCGIAACGVYDLPGNIFNGSFGWVESGQGRMKTTLWENPQRYLDNSPIYALNKLTTPLLVLQGDADYISKEQGKALFNALKRLGVSSEYVSIADMPHAPIHWTVEAQREFIPRLLNFLDKHLKN